MTEEAGILAQRIEKSMQKELRPVHLGGNFFSAKSLHFHAATARLARTFATCGSIGLLVAQVPAGALAYAACDVARACAPASSFQRTETSFDTPGSCIVTP
jgi:hypothetical protein